MKIQTILAGAAVVALAGCTTPSYNETYLSSTDEAGKTVYPTTQGFVDTYRPTYKVGDKKCVSNGIGDTREEARDNAIYNMCQQLKCDYVAAAKWTDKKDITCTKNKFLWIITFGHAHDEIYTSELIGFPVYIDGVETVKAKFYKQDANGELVETAPEHRIVWEKVTLCCNSACNVCEGKYKHWKYEWVPHELPGPKNIQPNAEPEVLRNCTVGGGATSSCGLFSHEVKDEDRVPAPVRTRNVVIQK